jgi:hypothetical protein
VRYDTEVACKNYFYENNTEEFKELWEDYRHNPGLQIQPKPKPDLLQNKTTTTDGCVVFSLVFVVFLLVLQCSFKNDCFFVSV